MLKRSTKNNQSVGLPRLRRVEAGPPRLAPGEAGSVLLLAVLVMSMVATVSFATATLIMQGSSHNRFLDYGTIAGYAAESGLEESLYALRRQSLPLGQLASSSLLSQTIKFTLTASSSEPYVLTNLSQDKTLPLDLGDFNDLSQDQPIEYLCFHWSSQADSRLVVNWTSWKPEGYVNPVCNTGELEPLPDFGQGGGDLNSFWNCQMLGVFSESTGRCSVAPTSSLSYKIKLTARGNDIDSLMVIAFTAVPDIVNLNGLDNPNQVSIPNRLFLQSIGAYPANSTNQANRTMSVSGPLYESSASLYDFVLFSEQPIVK
jgi:hypothetical protein